LAAPFSADDIATYVAMRPQEAQQGAANVWQWKMTANTAAFSVI
jgi:hypothetical protein